MGIIDNFNRGSAAGVKFENVGDEVVGVVTGIDSKQDADYDSELPLWWVGKKKTTTSQQGAQPVMVLILTLQCEPEGPEDDGLRSLWCRGNQHTAVMEALRAAFKGAKMTDDLIIGGKLYLKHHELGEKRPKMNPAKLFRAKFERRQIIDDVATDSEDPGAGAESW